MWCGHTSVMCIRLSFIHVIETLNLTLTPLVILISQNKSVEPHALYAHACSLMLVLWLVDTTSAIIAS